MNKVILSGRLTKDPQVYTDKSSGDVSAASFCLCVENYTDKNGEKIVSCVNCVTFKKTAEIVAKYLKKGMKIMIDGSWKTEKYTDREGNNRIVEKCLVSSIEFCEKKSQTFESNIEEPDSIPFR